MNMVIKFVAIVVFASVFFFGTLIFSGAQFCLPGFVDNGPGSVGCFYSSN